MRKPGLVLNSHTVSNLAALLKHKVAYIRTVKAEYDAIF
jgi:hypothetical protein